MVGTPTWRPLAPDSRPCKRATYWLSLAGCGIIEAMKMTFEPDRVGGCGKVTQPRENAQLRVRASSSKVRGTLIPKLIYAAYSTALVSKFYAMIFMNIWPSLCNPDSQRDSFFILCYVWRVMGRGGWQTISAR